MKRLPLLFLATLVATASFGQSNPCEDPVYLRLVDKDLDSMSDREFLVFQQKSAACTEFLLAHGTRTSAPEAIEPDSIAKMFSTKGVSFRAHFNATSWHLDDNRFFDDEQRGGGIGFGVSYGFNELVTLVFNVDAAGIQQDFGSDYAVVHGDLGVRFTFASNEKKLRPFAQVAFTGLGAERDFRVIISDDFRPGTVEAYGGGLAVGGGIMYFFNQKLALDIGLDLTFGEIGTVKYRDVSLDRDIASFSSRLNAGIAWYPW